MMIRPLHDRILAQRVDEQARASGGLFIPDNSVASLMLTTEAVIAEHSTIDEKFGD